MLSGADAVATVDLYLRDQVIRGDLRAESGLRLIDVLNGAKDTLLVLRDGVATGLHAEAPPVTLDAVRVQRAQTLLVVPAEVQPLALRRLRVGYVEKRPLRAHVGVGPLLLTATLHFGAREPASFEGFVYDVGARFFIPVTDASLASQYRPGWTLESPLVFVNRTAVEYGCLLEHAENPESDASVVPSSQDTWFRPSTRLLRRVVPPSDHKPD